MLHLGLSVSAGNILLWLLTEVFVVLMTFQATRFIARHSLVRSLNHGKKIRLKTSATLIDTLPYNGDLHPLPPRVKLPLTFLRIGAIALSVYLGYTLDAAVRTDHSPFPVTAYTAVAESTSTTLTPNDGSSIAAMAKISCLHIDDASHLALYKAFVNPTHILCQDGRVTFNAGVILEAELRPSRPSLPEGLPLAGTNLARRPPGPLVPGLRISDRYVAYESSGDSIRINLGARLRDGRCEFCIWRSQGSRFVNPVVVMVKTTCSLRILEFPRLLRAKPEHMPPRMAFLHQIVDAVVVSVPANAAPKRKGTGVVATVSIAGIVVLLCTAILTTAVAIVMWFLLRRATVQEDVMSPRGVASLWGCEKYGSEMARSSSGELFIAMDRNREVLYLGSVDKDSEESVDGGVPLDRRTFSAGFGAGVHVGNFNSEWSEPSGDDAG